MDRIMSCIICTCHALEPVEINAFPIEIAHTLHTASHKNRTSGWLPAGQIAALLHELDPNKSPAQIEMYMSVGRGHTVAQIGECTGIMLVRVRTSHGAHACDVMRCYATCHAVQIP